MPISTGVRVDGGVAVVVKQATGAQDEVERLRREGERLRRAEHPGVVSVVRSAPTVDGWELVTAHGGRALSALGPLDAGQVATVVAGVASTLADLHELGIVHGRITSSDVLVGDHGRTLLCGFGDGPGSADAADDVAALGRVLLERLGSDEEQEPIPDRRWRSRRRWKGFERRALLLLADQAMAEPSSRRPTARRFAVAVAQAVPGGTPRADGPEADHVAADPIERLRPDGAAVAPSGRRRARAALVGAAGVVLVVVAGTRLLASPPAASRPDPAIGPAAPSTTGAHGESVEVAAPVPGGVLVQDGRRYRVGQEGDHLLVGDWSCDGHPTPAVFRPSTREVFVFDRWTVSEPLSTRAIASVDASVALVSGRDAAGCPTLGVRTVDGDIVDVALGAPS